MIRRFSVALCTYQGAKYLAEQLSSLASQSRLPDELVICDDGSTDRTVEIIRTFANNTSIPVCLTINQARLGVVKNFEKAISLCSGELIALSDQDDVWHPEKLKVMEAKFLAAPNLGAVFSDAQIVDEHLDSLGYNLWQAIRFSPAEQHGVLTGNAFQVLLRHNVVTGATLAFRSVFRGSVIPIAETWMHDGWIAINIAARAEIAMINQPLIKYRQHGANQIGGRKLGLVKLFRAAKQNDSDSFFNAAAKFQLLYERLQKAFGPSEGQIILSSLQDKIDHLNNRSRIHDRSYFHLSLALKELISANYHRYSRGWQSFARDLWLRGK